MKNNLFIVITIIMGMIQMNEAGQRIGDEKIWQPLNQAIEDYHWISNMAFSIHNESGIQYIYEKGNTSYTSTVMNVASTTKWMSATSILQVVAEGKMSLNDKVNQYIDFWTKDEKDDRSKITLKHCLSFTTGYYTDSFGAGNVTCFQDENMDYMDCLKEFYDSVDLTYKPGTTWDYSSFHLKIAGGMAIKATNQSMVELLNKTMLQLDMKNSYYDMKNNPELAGSLYTTGEDYDKLLTALYHKTILPVDIIKIMEEDHTPRPRITASPKSRKLAAFVGHYGLGNWSPECIVSKPWNLRRECYEESIHTSPGIFGYYPLIDRYRGYWMQVVFKGHAIIGCINGWGARVALKPIVDAIMDGVHTNDIVIPKEKEIRKIQRQIKEELSDFLEPERHNILVNTATDFAKTFITSTE